MLAFGSPFGIQNSVTRGIVSAVNRQNPYADDARKPGGFIQTDAAINPGNSGGALVNSHGQLVGINTFIISNSGSFAGAGFAIPSQLAQSVTAQLIRSGSVHHGYLGISIEDVTPANASFFKLQQAEGAIVSQVTPDSPGSRAGLRNGDVVLALNDRKVMNSSELQTGVAEDTPGMKISLEILRDGARQTLNVTLGEFSAKATQEANLDDSAEPGVPAKPGKLGLAVSNLTPDLRQQLHLPETLHGVAIQTVRPASPAEEAALAPGDIILEVNRQAITSADQFVNQVHATPADKDMLLLVWSRGNARLPHRSHRRKQGLMQGRKEKGRLPGAPLGILVPVHDCEPERRQLPFRRILDERLGSLCRIVTPATATPTPLVTRPTRPLRYGSLA